MNLAVPFTARCDVTYTCVALATLDVCTTLYKIEFNIDTRGVESILWQTHFPIFFTTSFFSTKNRENFIFAETESRVWAYIGGVARKHKLTALQIGGTENHIHALIMAPPTIAPSQIAQWIKGDSSKWIHVEFLPIRGFAWQDGYGIFSVSKSHVPRVVEYIQNQRQHHLNQSFEEEYVELLKLHEIDYDERFLLG